MNKDIPLDRRLKSKIVIDKLFVEGQSLFLFPVKLVYRKEIDITVYPSGVQYGVSVSRRLFKKAVDRNKIKRRMREAIRLHFSLLNLPSKQADHYTSMMFIYVGKEMLDYKVIERAMKILLKKMEKNI